MENARLSVSYAFEIYRKSFCEIWECFGMGGKVIDGLVIIISLSAKAFWNRNAEALIGEWDIWTILFLVALFVIPGLAIFNAVKVAALRDKTQRNQLSLKEYEDIKITQLEYPWTDNDQRIGAPGLYNIFKLGLCVTNNGGVSLKNCSVRLMLVEYSGRPSNNEWVPSPSPVDNKLFKWDEGYDIPNGRIERIGSNGSIARLFFAESNRYSQEFRFAFIDGMSKTDQNLEGRYRVTGQLDGEVEKDGKIVDLIPLEFSVEFDFQRKQFSNMSILKFPRNAT